MPTFPAKLLRQNPAWAAVLDRQAPKAKRRPGGGMAMNGTERAYNDRLLELVSVGEVLWFGFNEVRLRVGVGAWFKPDFAVYYADGRLEFHETKGFEREAAMVRIKAAADRYPQFPFLLVKRAGKRWTHEQIGGSR